MTVQHIMVVPVKDEHIPEIVELVRAQESRWYRLDPRLRAARSIEQVEAMLQRDRTRELSPVVALDGHERVCGYVRPTIWQLQPEDGLRAFFTERNGMAQALTLPDPANPIAVRVATALFSTLTHLWSQHQAHGEMVRWPCCDLWLDQVVHKQGFLLDSALAYQVHPPTLESRPFPEHVVIRPARPMMKRLWWHYLLRNCSFMSLIPHLCV
ncbi:hypothetical protein [Dictyobacter kobayashii]|uniref:hypothetical protein n=1 Tax=Dictyobacter kobayashii TaxID=2014872 RepID=UPI000F8311EC|nr:hypothetical protein [Dictyobacter kobayashii]